MGLEAGVTKLSDLDPTWPLSTDLRHYGDDHLRNIKVAVKSLLPGGVTEQLSHADLLLRGANTHAQLDTAVNGLATTYAPIAKGVTNGDTHDHLGGDGAQIDHVNLASKGTNTHTQIDAHIADTTKHLPGFVDRGDIAAADKSSWTLSTWTDWDLSAIVPANAKAVLLGVYINHPSAGKYLKFRKNGHVGAYAATAVVSQVGGASFETNLVIACDSLRVIEYYTPDSGWSVSDAMVRGWFF